MFSYPIVIVHFARLRLALTNEPSIVLQNLEEIRLAKDQA